jgi:hypothetical protein
MAINEFVPKTPLSAEHLNRIVRSVNELNPNAGEVSNGEPQINLFRTFVGEISTSGPSGESNYSDCRYWVSVCKNTSTTNPVSTQLPVIAARGESNAFFNKKVTAINLGEYLSGTHTTFSSGDKVIILPVIMDAITRYLIIAPAIKTVNKTVVTDIGCSGGRVTKTTEVIKVIE